MWPCSGSVGATAFMRAFSSSDISEYGFDMSAGVKRAMKIYGGWGGYTFLDGGSWTKYDFGQVKLGEFEHSLPVAATSKLEGRAAFLQISSVEGLFISSFPPCCSVCHVSLPCRRRCQ